MRTTIEDDDDLGFLVETLYNGAGLIIFLTCVVIVAVLVGVIINPRGWDYNLVRLISIFE